MADQFAMPSKVQSYQSSPVQSDKSSPVQLIPPDQNAAVAINQHLLWLANSMIPVCKETTSYLLFYRFVLLTTKELLCYRCLCLHSYTLEGVALTLQNPPCAYSIS